jgi:hypothetical protein
MTTSSSVLLNVDPRCQVLKCEMSQIEKSIENSIACRPTAVHNVWGAGGARRRRIIRTAGMILNSLAFLAICVPSKPRGF